MVCSALVGTQFLALLGTLTIVTPLQARTTAPAPTAGVTIRGAMLTKTGATHGCLLLSSKMSLKLPLLWATATSTASRWIASVTRLLLAAPTILMVNARAIHAVML